MNQYRLIGGAGLSLGALALALLWLDGQQSGAWLPAALAALFREEALVYLLGGIAAVASGLYLVLFGQDS